MTIPAVPTLVPAFVTIYGPLLPVFLMDATRGISSQGASAWRAVNAERTALRATVVPVLPGTNIGVLPVKLSQGLAARGNLLLAKCV